MDILICIFFPQDCSLPHSKPVVSPLECPCLGDFCRTASEKLMAGQAMCPGGRGGRGGGFSGAKKHKKSFLLAWGEVSGQLVTQRVWDSLPPRGSPWRIGQISRSWLHGPPGVCPCACLWRQCTIPDGSWERDVSLIAVDQSFASPREQGLTIRIWVITKIHFICASVFFLRYLEIFLLFLLCLLSKAKFLKVIFKSFFSSKPAFISSGTPLLLELQTSHTSHH